MFYLRLNDILLRIFLLCSVFHYNICSENENRFEVGNLRSSTIMNRIVNFEEIHEISKNGGTILIDVREPNEIEETGLIPNSINIPMNQVEKELGLGEKEFSEKYGNKKPTYDSPIIITCRSGRRAEIIMNNLEKLGYKNTKYYAGSWLEWASKQT